MSVQFIVAVITSALIVDMAWMTALVTNVLTTKTLRQWYKDFQLGAVLSDVTSASACILLVSLWLPLQPNFMSIARFCSVAVGFQMAHDLALYELSKNSSSRILTLFRKYGEENGALVLAADASIIVTTALLALALQTLPYTTLLVLLVTALYILPYLLYSV